MNTAHNQYNIHQASIRSLIKRLEAHLDAHQEQANANPRDWGYVGDVAYIDTHLKTLSEGFLKS